MLICWQEQQTMPPSSGKLERPWKHGLDNISASDSTPCLFCFCQIMRSPRPPSTVQHLDTDLHPCPVSANTTIGLISKPKWTSINIDLSMSELIYFELSPDKRKFIGMNLASRAAICSSQACSALRQILDVSHSMWPQRWICLEPRSSKWQRRCHSRLNT